MEPVILKRPKHNVSRKDISSAAVKVLYRLKDEGYLAYLAGGGVRDLLLNRNPKDFDVVTDATPNEIRRIFKNCRLVGRRFRLAHILFRGEIIETSTFRAPAPPSDEDTCENTFRKEDGMVMRDNVFGTPEQDAMRRDFTINALFYNIADFSIIDYANGLQDLEKKIIRVIGAPDQRFTEDPVRMIRAARFAGTLKFEIEKEAFESICRNREKLALASPARMYDEVQKLFFCGHAKAVYEWLEKTDLLHPMFHDFSHWVDEDTNRRNWVMKTLEQLDLWRNAGLKIHPPLLFTLIFGEYHEFLAKKLQVENTLQPFEAARDAVFAHLSTLIERVRVPKQVIQQVADIMSNQVRFQRTRGKQPSRFLKHRGFPDAFLYFKFSGKIYQRDQELIDYWSNFRKKR